MAPTESKGCPLPNAEAMFIKAAKQRQLPGGRAGCAAHIALLRLLPRDLRLEHDAETRPGGLREPLQGVSGRADSSALDPRDVGL
jgi:hypothetical protein